MPRLVDNPHAAAGDLFEQFVIAEVTDGGEHTRTGSISNRRHDMTSIARQPQRLGLAIDSVEVGEKGAKRFGQLAMQFEQLLTVGHLSCFDGLQVISDHLVKARKRFGRVIRCSAHELSLSNQARASGPPARASEATRRRAHYGRYDRRSAGASSPGNA